MTKCIRILLLCTAISLCFISFSFASDMPKGLQCPPGWTEKEQLTDVKIIKKCISPARDAFVELYEYPEMGISLGQLIDGWTKQMTEKGMPFQTQLSESQSHVSGLPALSRTYVGSTGSGANFSSTVTASRYNNKKYILLGMHLKGHQKTREQVQHAMSTWKFLGAKGHDKTMESDSGNFKNIGSCWAWGFWKDASGKSVLIIPDGRIIFNGHQEKRWRPREEDSIVVELPAEQGSGTAIWSHPEGRNDTIIRKVLLNEQPDIKPILTRAAWKYNYKGEWFRACQK